MHDAHSSHDRGIPYEPSPKSFGIFGDPEDCFEQVNKYGTYNIQPTADADHLFPLISHALPSQWKGIAIGKEEAERFVP